MKWKRIIAWSAGILAGLLIIAITAGYFVLRSQGFHQYVLAKIVQQGNEATGGKVEVRNFDFRISTLTAHLYGFTIHGTEPVSSKPLLEVDKLTVGLKVLSVLHHRVNLSELLIEHPVVNLVVDKNGRTNIPVPSAPKNKSSNTDVFDLAVGHVLLSNGEVDYKDRKTPMDADVRDLRAETHFNLLTKSYVGGIVYHVGRVQYGGLAPLPHSFAATFDASPSALNLPSIVFTIGSSRATLQANVADYNNLRVEGTYSLLIHPQDASGLASGTRADGNIVLNGKLNYRAVYDHPFLRDVKLDGQVSSDVLRIGSAQGNVELRRLSGSYQLADGNFQTRDFAVNLLNGRLAATLTVQHLDTNPASKLHAALSGISLQAVKAALNDSAAKTVPVTGTLQATADASWIGAMTNLRMRSDLNIRAAAAHSTANGTSAIPVNATAHLTYDGPDRILAVRETTIRTPRSSIMADGQISDHSKLILHASTSDLHEVAMFATIVQSQTAPADGKTSQSLDVSGAADLHAMVKGSWQKPNITAQLNAQHLAIEGSEWRALNLAAEAGPSGISIQNGSLIGARQGQLSFSASAELRNWSYVASDPITVKASVQQIPAAEIEELARVHYPIEGNISGNISLSGSELNPAGSGSLRLNQARAADEPVQNLEVQFHASNGTIASSVNVSLPAGSASADLTFVPRTRKYKFKVNAPAIVLSRLQTIEAKNLSLSGTVTASANGEEI